MAAIKSYIGDSVLKKIDAIRKNINTDTDIMINADILFQTLDENGI